MNAELRGQRLLVAAALLTLNTTPAVAQVRTADDSVWTDQLLHTTLVSKAGLALLPRPAENGFPIRHVTGSPRADSSRLKAAGPYHPGSRTLAFGETLLGNLVPWMFNEYVTRYKDITRISPTTWKNNLAAGPQWDDNHFHINLLMHPFAGSLYYSAGRTNGYNFEKSFLFTLVGSAAWECCGESHRPSWGDLLSTTVGGTALGEMFYRWTSQMLNRANRVDALCRPAQLPTPRNGWWEVPVAVLSPIRTFTRWTLGRFSAPNPAYECPDSWALHTALGAGTGNLRFFETGYTYADVITVTKRARPFAHFESLFELDFGGVKQTLSRVQSRGSLWSRRYVGSTSACLITPAIAQGAPGIPAISNCNVNYFNLVPYIGFDYINNDAYEFGGQSIGLAAFLTLGMYPNGTHGILTVDAHGLFGAVQSEHAKRAQLHDPRSERDREYDFTMGTGFSGAAIVSHKCLRASGFYRMNKHHVLNGSNEDTGPATHRTTLLGINARCKFWHRLGAGFDYRRYTRDSHFDPSLNPPGVQMHDDRFRLFLTLDRRRPLGLFVF